MNTKEICDNIFAIYEDTNKSMEQRYPAIFMVTKMGITIDREHFTDNDLKPILELAKKVAPTKKSIKQLLETELLKTISYLPRYLWLDDEGEKKRHFERSTHTEEGKIAESLIQFAKEIYTIKLDRDAFAGKRRGYAIEILQSVSDYFDTPEFMELCAKSIKNKSKNEFLAVTESLKLYYSERRDESLNEDIISIVKKRVDKTKHRAELIGGLTLLVDTGVISEFEALDKRDEWRERMDSW